MKCPEITCKKLQPLVDKVELQNGGTCVLLLLNDETKRLNKMAFGYEAYAVGYNIHFKGKSRQHIRVSVNSKIHPNYVYAFDKNGRVYSHRYQNRNSATVALKEK